MFKDTQVATDSPQLLNILMSTDMHGPEMMTSKTDSGQNFCLLTHVILA